MSHLTIPNGCPLADSTAQNTKIEKNEECVQDPSSVYSNSKGQVIHISPLNGEYFELPNAPIKCTWNKDSVKNGIFSPHITRNWKNSEKIQPNILKQIGNTPMVKLNAIPKAAGIKCNMYAKLEYLNPGGSVKDRIAIRMVEEAEEQDLLKPGMTIIEASSGNTGIGLAMTSAVKGYKCIIVTKEKISNEKATVLRALGAQLIYSNSWESIFEVANRVHKETPSSLVLDQFSNPGNSLAHYDTTAEEILYQCDHKIDAIVLGSGTGGTVTGVGRKFKEVSPQTKIVGVDPIGSIYALPECINQHNKETYHEVEGLGFNFIPTSIDRSVVDHWVKVDDEETFKMARRLIREEGLLCGVSSGAVVSAALKVAADLKEGQNLVVLLADSVRNYLSDFVSDHWMEARSFQICENVNEHWWWEHSVNTLKYKKVTTVPANESCENVLKIIDAKSTSHTAVVKPDGNILGTITRKHLINAILAKVAIPSEEIRNCTIKTYPKIDIKTGTLGLLSRILEKENYVIVTETCGNGQTRVEKPLGVIDIDDLYEYTCS